MATAYLFVREVGPYRAGDRVAKLGEKIPHGPGRAHHLDPQRFDYLVKSKAIAAKPEPKEPEPEREPEPKPEPKKVEPKPPESEGEDHG